MIVLALDVGQARIGVAVSDSSGVLASPRGVIRRRSNAVAFAAIARAVAETAAEVVVVGLPITLDGQIGPQAQAVRAFGRQLAARLPVPVVYWDERLSTVAAAEALRAAGVRPDQMRERIDAAAAAIILQEYLDDQRNRARARERTAESEAALNGAPEQPADAARGE